MDFEWDEAKAAHNLTKHGVSFAYASRVFLDPYRLEEEDPADPAGEIRHRVIGLVEDRVLLVVYTYREDRIRIISARRATRHERRKYHEV
jgi:uncharacterized DUF497 family protein